jgi:hypothetical protein
VEYRGLLEIKPGTVLQVAGVPFRVSQVINYKCRTTSWFNLVDQTSLDGEKVIELSDGDIRLWQQVKDLPGVSPATESVDYRGHHFEVDESRVKAKTLIRNEAGEEAGDSVTSIYVTEDDENILLSVEIVEKKIFVWYSDRMISPREIKL